MPKTNTLCVCSICVSFIENLQKTSVHGNLFLIVGVEPNLAVMTLKL